MALSDDDKQQIQLDIFRITGQKLDQEDPAVIAALFYATKLREALQEATPAMQDLMRNVEKTIEESVQAHLAKLIATSTALQKTNEQAYLRMVEGTKAAVMAFVPIIKKELLDCVDGVAKGTLKRTGANQVDFLKRINLFSAAGIIVLTVLFGIFIGSTWYGQNMALSKSEEQQLAMGKVILKVIPLMDKATKEKLMKLLAENSEARIDTYK